MTHDLTIDPPLDETIEGNAQALRDGRRTCLDVLDACLARIDAWEPKVHAWVLVDREGARGQARALEEEREAGRLWGPLHGIPVGIKDIVNVTGQPTAAGFGPWVQRASGGDAPIVARLRAAGAVILGKTVTTPFAWIDPPPTRNPWNLDRTPGGSSSGSAAALACGMALGAIGSQTGGSITRPAAFCGVAGLKPTFGRLSAEGIVPLAPSLDHPGPLARTVGDLAALWETIAGPDPRDQRDMPGATIRLGRPRGLFHDRAEPAMREALDGALDALQASGMGVTETALPGSFADVIRCHRLIMAAEAASWHEPLRAEHLDAYPPRIRDLVAEGLSIPATEYIRCRQHQDQLRREILACFEGIDALATPAAMGTAPDPTTTGDPVMNSPWSYTGLPTVNLPIGLSPEGLPLGLQLVGRPFGERALLEVARRCETILRSRRTGGAGGLS